MHPSGTLRRLASCLIRPRALILGAALAALLQAQASAKVARRAPLELNVFGPTRPLTDTAWLVDRVGKNRRFELGSEPLLALLERYVEPGRDRTPEWQSFWHGRYGRNHFQLHPKLNWFGSEPEPAAGELEARGESVSLELRS